MSIRDKDSGVDGLVKRPGMKLVNVKFCRGLADIITSDEFKAQLTSASIQAKTGRSTAETSPPHSGRKAVDIREFVENL